MDMFEPTMWIMKITPDDSANTSIYFQKLFLMPNCKNLIGYTKNVGEIERFEKLWKKMKIGDLIVVMEGHNKVHGVVEITSDAFDDTNKQADINTDWFYHRRKARLIKYFNPALVTKDGTNRDTIIEYSGNGAMGIIDEVWDIIKKDYYMTKSKTSSIEVLKHKYQIILQGPPGTGKTRLAKQIAEELTKPRIIGTISSFEEKIKNIQPNLELRKKREDALNSFLERFSIDKLPHLTLKEYAMGTGEKNKFSWWISYGLKDLGTYAGSAKAYLLYWSKSKSKYIKKGILLKNAKNVGEAFQILKDELIEFITKENFVRASQYFGESLLLKILHSYYPEKYAPINSPKVLNNILQFFGEPYELLSIIEKNKKVKEIIENRIKQINPSISIDEFVDFWFSGKDFNPDENLKIENDQIQVVGEYQIIQFHPSYSYEDFVRGISVETSENGQPKYKVTNRILIEMAQKALENPSANYVLIIDEINRANLSSVLGELIYALEYRYEPKKDNKQEASVQSMYAYLGEDEAEPNRTLILPTNFYIIGTMNTADRSVGHIDYAVRRRFAFIDVFPDASPVHQLVKDKFEKMTSLFIENGDINKSSKHLSLDFKPYEVMLGHSYFICENENDAQAEIILQMKMRYEVLPILKEYLKDGVLVDSEEVNNIINGLVF